eukprot:5535412-Lingulodinium_polyedra.AAC.1
MVAPPPRGGVLQRVAPRVLARGKSRSRSPVPQTTSRGWDIAKGQPSCWQQGAPPAAVAGAVE